MSTTSRKPLPLTGIPVGAWSVIATESRVDFSLRKLWWTVRGQMDIDGQLQTTGSGPEADRVTLSGRGHVKSVDTGLKKRDQDILTAKLFDADAHPYVRLEAEGGRIVSDGKLRLSGRLTIRETTRPVELVADVQLEGDRLRLTGALALDRTDYGLTVGQRKPGKGRLIGHEVNLNFDVLLAR